MVSVIFTVGVLAGTTLQKITAYRDFSVVTKVNNLDKKFGSAKAPLYPVLYNNKYYVPVEEFCQANMIPVNYDAKKKIYYFGKKDGKVALSDIKDRDLSYMGKIIKINHYWFQMVRLETLAYNCQILILLQNLLHLH